MQNNIALLSIKPNYFEKLSNQRKFFEYRKVIFNSNVEYIIFYLTSPIKLVKAYTKKFTILTDTVDEIWNKTQNQSGIDKQEYFQYFQNSRKAYAIQIHELIYFQEPLTLNQLCGKSSAPQNFYYLSPHKITESILL